MIELKPSAKINIIFQKRTKKAKNIIIQVSQVKN